MFQRFLFSILCFILFSTRIFAQSELENGIKYIQNQDYKNAVSCFLKALEDGEDYYWIYNNIVNCYINLGELEKSLDYAIRGYEKYPDTVIIRDTYIWALTALGWDKFNSDLKSSEDYFFRAYELFGQNPDVLNGYGCVLKDSPEKEKVHMSVRILDQGFKLKPEHGYLLKNLYYAFFKSLDIYFEDKDFPSIRKLAFFILDHYHEYNSYYSQNEFSEQFLYSFINALFHRYCLYTWEGEELDSCIVVMEELLNEYPDNYLLRHTLGASNWEQGEKNEGFNIVSRAYEDYLRVINPEEITSPIIEVPVKGKILLASGWNSFNGHTHAGLWRYAIDLIVLDKDDKNITYGTSVYSSVEGVVSDIDNTDESNGFVSLYVGDDLNIGFVHLKPGSITVSLGQKITPGMKLGVVGKEEHLHVHIFNEYGVTVPFLFKEYHKTTGEEPTHSMPIQGEVFNYQK